ncbi:hypothetical protein, partial [Variovorax soli]|uniref:hypothetical protein n=1 Tax=Variovorax soli TaxID=376815 RepID=UPI001C3F3B15
ATSNQQPATSNQQPATSNQQPATRHSHILSNRHNGRSLECVTAEFAGLSVSGLDALSAEFAFRGW